MSTRRILSIDGGGIKGVLPAAFLATVEDVTGKRVLDHFDLIAGTSTGGIIALGLALDRPASRLLDLYTKYGGSIFAQDEGEPLSFFTAASRRCRELYRSVRGLRGPKYEPEVLRRVLKAEYGDAHLGDCRTRVVIPAFDRNRRDLYVFKTAHHERLRSDWPHLALDVALATAAAPTYFPEHSLSNGISLIDGGVWANNPVGLAVVEAIGVLGWEPESLRVLSIGCTEDLLRIPAGVGKAHVETIIDVFMLGQSRAAMGTAKLLTGHMSGRHRVYRYQEVVPRGTYAMDSSRQIRELRGLGTSLARHSLEEVLSVFFESPREPFLPLHGAVPAPAQTRHE